MKRTNRWKFHFYCSHISHFSFLICHCHFEWIVESWANRLSRFRANFVESKSLSQNAKQMHYILRAPTPTLPAFIFLSVCASLTEYVELMNCFDSHLSRYRYRTHPCLVCAWESWSNDSFQQKCLRVLNLNRQHLDFSVCRLSAVVRWHSSEFVAFAATASMTLYSLRGWLLHRFGAAASGGAAAAAAESTESIKITSENNLFRCLWTLSWCQSDTLTLRVLGSQMENRLNDFRGTCMAAIHFSGIFNYLSHWPNSRPNHFVRRMISRCLVLHHVKLSKLPENGPILWSRSEY